MRDIKPNYIITPLLFLFIAGIGRYFSESGQAWYNALVLPDIIPPGWVFGIVWNVLYISLAITTTWLINYVPRDRTWPFMMFLLITNLVANGLWCFLFFNQHLIFIALIDCIVVFVTSFILMIFLMRYSIGLATVLLPYVGWIAFASYLNYLIWIMNP